MLVAVLAAGVTPLVPCASEAFCQDVDFENDIAPIFENNCIFCHGEDEQEAGLRLDRRQSMLRGGDSGLPTIVPGDSKNSYLMDVVNHVDEEMAMPPDEDKIAEEEIELLSKWIEQGAQWPGQMEALVEEKSDHWSFHSIVRPEVPVAGAADAEGSAAIDAFLLKRLQQDGLEFSQPADPRSLLRRLAIVLTGIPPTPEESTAFVEAYGVNSESAYAAAVDRMMASPHFGERWAQHWLDVIRWAETNGSESNSYRKNAWIYRDYVIRAFNEDKPYDQFLTEQIAGDTMGQGDATGYLVSGPHVPQATVGAEPSAQRQARADRMDEILQTVGATAMGMTIGCARCHNHKFDPISIRDYYSLSAVFQGVEFGARYPELDRSHPRRMRGAELMKEIRGLRNAIRETGPWEEDWVGYREVFLPKTKAKSVRFIVAGKSVRIDELEIFGPEHWNKNLALASGGTEVEVAPGVTNPNMAATNVNNGEYGNRSWVAHLDKRWNKKAKAKKNAKSKEKAKGKTNGESNEPESVAQESETSSSEDGLWVQLNFPHPQEITRVRVSTNREDFLETDYLVNLNNMQFLPYRIEVRETDDSPWVEVFDSRAAEKANEAPQRATTLEKIHQLIAVVSDEGPKPSFVGKFIEPVKTFVLGRGSPENPRDEVFAAGLSEIDGDLGLPADATDQQRRRAFADWVTSETNPLTARVAVNRFWHHVFGRGIVTTTSDFGAAGAPPTHPELLEWLASEFLEPSIVGGKDEAVTVNPWSTKHLIRLMVMSKAFRQSSLPREDALRIDGDAALLWRFPPKRVEAEVIRDGILQASGVLDETVGGRSFRIHNVKQRYAQWEVTDNYGSETWRRMIYQERMRRVDDQMFTAFDFPDCGQVRAKRPVSTTPLQALNLMNSNFVIQQSRKIAQRAIDDVRDDDGDGHDQAKAVDRCFELLLSRDPAAEELEACVAVANEIGLEFVCRALINSNEFAFLP